MKKSFFVQILFTFAFMALSSVSFGQALKKDFYELKVYHVSDDVQEQRVERYLKNAYLPAMHKAGIKNIGVFKPVKEDSTSGKVIYVFVPYTSFEEYSNVALALQKDESYLQSGKDYLDAAHDNAAYDRIETIFMQAFAGMPHFRLSELNNPKEERIYELRSYESATEKLFHNKVAMFNNGEIEIFERLGFNPVFYGEVISGKSLPNLMYMTTHADKTTQEKNWKAFGSDSAWNKMKVMDEYQNNVSHIDIFLLRPVDYSDI